MLEINILYLISYYILYLHIDDLRLTLDLYFESQYLTILKGFS